MTTDRAQFALAKREPDDDAVADILPQKILTEVYDVSVEPIDAAERDRSSAPNSALASRLGVHLPLP